MVVFKHESFIHQPLLIHGTGWVGTRRAAGSHFHPGPHGPGLRRSGVVAGKVCAEDPVVVNPTLCLMAIECYGYSMGTHGLFIVNQSESWAEILDTV